MIIPHKRLFHKWFFHRIVKIPFPPGGGDGRIMLTVYQALEEKGYNPVNQIVGYILSEDPTYITNHNQARTLIRKVDRDELMQILVRNYLLK